VSLRNCLMAFVRLAVKNMSGTLRWQKPCVGHDTRCGGGGSDGEPAVAYLKTVSAITLWHEDKMMSPSHHYYTEYFTVDGRTTLLWAGSCHARAIVPCCDCGWHGNRFYDDDPGRSEALVQWKREHLASPEGTGKL
jgi:hypothetical protein